jgi:hypothetical protein
MPSTMTASAPARTGMRQLRIRGGGAGGRVGGVGVAGVVGASGATRRWRRGCPTIAGPSPNESATHVAWVLPNTSPSRLRPRCPFGRSVRASPRASGEPERPIR